VEGHVSFQVQGGIREKGYSAYLTASQMRSHARILHYPQTAIGMVNLKLLEETGTADLQKGSYQ
jgi:hypothetical protein